MPNTRYVGDSTRALRACDGGKDPGTKQACVTLNKGLHCSEPLSFPTCACGWQSRARGWSGIHSAQHVGNSPRAERSRGLHPLPLVSGLCPRLGSIHRSWASAAGFSYIDFLACRSLPLLVCLGLDWSLPGGSVGKESTCNAGDPGSIPVSGRYPWRREWQPTSVFFPGESHGQRSLAGYGPWGCKQLDTTECTFTARGRSNP